MEEEIARLWLIKGAEVDEAYLPAITNSDGSRKPYEGNEAAWNAYMDALQAEYAKLTQVNGNWRREPRDPKLFGWVERLERAAADERNDQGYFGV